MELTEQMQDFLSERRFAVLATNDQDGPPQQTVMWYELVDDYVLMNTARGRVKDSHLQRDPRASICIEDGYRYLTISGTVALEDDQTTAQADIARLARRYHGAQADAQIAQFQKQHRVTIRLTIEHVIANGFDR
ncbi:MAG: PPOX class F420-dependent oxidoreductase [Chloroflexota bacterium]|nr:PPOX class F420-dependent oxidoreductase [Chloroflexota bacterium]